MQISSSWPRSAAIGFGLVLALSSPPVSADVWDNDPGNEDDGSSTDNEIFHGTVQVHDLASQGGTIDEDWYVVFSRPFSSYEVMVDGLQGEVFGPGGNLPVDRVNVAGTVLTAGATPQDGVGAAQSVRWANNAGAVMTDYVRVDGVNTSCGTACTTDTQYTIRMWETTASIPRFNNFGSQLTLMLLQNPTNYTISGTIYFWQGSTGTFLASHPFSLDGKELLLLNTNTVTPGSAGSMTIAHNGRFGDLQGKSVALEPSTGFSFDTPLLYRPH